MTTHNLINDEENHHLIQPYDGSYEPTHFDDEDEASITEDEDFDEYKIEEGEYL